MAPGEIIGVCMAAGIVVALVTTIAVKWRQTHTPWTAFPEYRDGMWCYFEKGGTQSDRIALARAMASACNCLTLSAGWNDIGKALVDLHIHVKSTETWTEDTGTGPRAVAGLQMDSGVRVGPSFAALCHEIAHRYQQVTADPLYPTHDKWAELGIYRAIDAYQSSTILTSGAQ